MGNSPVGGTARPARFYTSDDWIEGRAERQLDDVSAWPGMRAVAGFPDLHPGRHGPVGAAFAADRLYPQLVGPDIGCGMTLFRLSLPRRKLKLDKAARRMAVLDAPPDPEDAHAALEAAGLGFMPSAGLGTIGGGNHFCELQEVVAAEKGPAPGALTLLVHSGSRSLGHGVFSALEGRWAEGYAADSEEGAAYLTLHDRAVAWAAANRRLIAARAAEALRCALEEVADAPHNLVTRENGLWLHRKGAARPEGGLAPLAGSRDDHSYLMRAAPPAGALGSMSHGAGRRHDRSSMHGRVRAKKSDLVAMARNRFGGHVVCADRALMVEEAGQAYKPAAAVARSLEAFGVARRVATLAPLLTFKVAGKMGEGRA